MQRLLLFVLIFSLQCTALSAQSVLQQQVSLRVENSLLEASLYQLADENSLRFSFSNDLLPLKTIDADFQSAQLSTVLDALLSGTPLSYRELGSQVVIYLPEGLSYTINGILEDAGTGERLIEANVLEARSGRGTTTNEYGYYSLTLPPGPIALSFSYVGYRSAAYSGYLMEGQRRDVKLAPELTLQAVEVVEQKSLPKAPISLGNGNMQLSMEQIEQLPALAGEADVMRSLHLMPGVQTGTDGIGGLHVRGGNNGHNLIMIDGVPVYNVAHAAGLFSVFNTNAVRSAKLYRGGFPARYGGRLSSVLDIRTKDGNKHEFGARGDVGLLSGRLTLEGPIQKGKSSFIFSGRRSLVGWYLQPLAESLWEEESQQGQLDYHFHDLNAKLNFELSEKDNLYFSLYQGRDRYGRNGERSDTLSIIDNTSPTPVSALARHHFSEQIGWNNTVASLQWTHLFGERLFGRMTAYYSGLQVGMHYSRADSLTRLASGSVTDRSISIGDYGSRARDAGLRLDFDYQIQPEHSLRFGLNAIQHSFLPGVLSLQIDQKENTGAPHPSRQERRLNAMEYAAYMENEIALGPALQLNAGLHLAAFSTTSKTYTSLQPRISAQWKPRPRLQLGTYFSKMTQFIHLLSNETHGLPAELWVPVTDDIRPQQGWQLGSSVAWHWSKGWTLSGELYAKRMRQLLAYSEGTLLTNDWEQNVTAGTGRAHGLELMLEKRVGKTYGWASYGLAWADRQFPLINKGQPFPYRYDRRHDFKLALVHRFSDWLEASATWVVNSGFAFSLPIVQYQIFIPERGPIKAVDFGERNRLRMPLYHRLDLGINIYVETDEVKHTLRLGVYNAYNRRNPVYYDLRDRYVPSDDGLEREATFVPVWLLPLMPSLNYSLQF